MLSRSTFQTHLLSTRWYTPGQRILCACSGGIDSTVMLRLLLELPETQVDIIHFNHQLRGVDSQADLEFVLQLGQQYQCPVHVVSENIREYAGQHKLSLEEAGSRRRRAAFQKTMADVGCEYIAIGQHVDDQLETILLNLYLGSGIKGLAGIAESQDYYVRPLMGFTRVEIEKYARQAGLNYRIDRSNSDIAILRNNIRAKLVPFLNKLHGPDWGTHLKAISQLGNQLQEKIESSAVVVDNIDIRGHEVQNISLGLGKLADYFSPIQKVVFDRAFQAISCMPQGLSTKHFKALRSLLPKSAVAREIQLPDAVTATRNRNGITFIRRQDHEWDPILMTDLNQTLFPFFKLEYCALTIHERVKEPDTFWYNGNLDAYRLRQNVEGDKLEIQPSGKRISVRQILQEAHVAPYLKCVYPVLEHRGEIVWVPGIRTAVSAMVDMATCKENEVKHCFRVVFQEGTFE